ncbi:MAG: heavy-metal-associated domain-containing protein [Chitinophagaceae bacterium]|nr:heavy-metal-associated domain-containing protein [Chitinophagaceae bacterium]
MKKIFLIAAIGLSVAANSQVTKVSLQASGLTCSMCSNAIYKALKSLDFVDKIDANIKTSTFEISFKPNSKVDFEKLKKKVEDAGFFVARFTATMYFNNVKIKSNDVISVGDKTLQFVNVKEQNLSGAKTIRIIDKGFVSSKEYKKNSVGAAVSKNGKIYHVTI